VVKEIRATGREARGYTADAREVPRIADLVERIEHDTRGIDILLNSQGVTLLKPAEAFTEDEFDLITETNLKSVFFACTLVGKKMLARGSGSIINIASLAAFRGWGQSAVYSISKWGVVSITETLGREWATRGVRVNAIAPGFFMTELNKSRMSAERKAEAIHRTPMGRFGELGELVGAAIYLASSASSYVTGSTIRVDGGYLASGI
jgi:NAD(P)-dependent dehydrogenase (short-subunit alcohol dehydrogenase family)